MAKIKITQTGSPIRRHKTQRATLVGLGLNKMHRTVEVEATPEVLGQVRKVAVRAAPAGTGIIAGGPMRAVFEALGMHDVVSKSLGSSNPYNLVRATFDALKHEDSPRSVAARRGLKVSQLQARRGDADAAASAEA